jgi:hypothetical protein
VIGVQDEGGVEGRGVLGRRLDPQQHVQEVRCVRQLRAGWHDLLAGAQTVVGGDQGRGLRHEPHGLAVLGFRRLVPSVGIVGGGRGKARAQHRHRGGLLGELGHQLLEQDREVALVHEELDEVVQLVAVWKPGVVQQVDGLLEGDVARKVGDVVAGVPQPSGLAVDVGDPGLSGDDLAEALLRHVRSLPVAAGSTAGSSARIALAPDMDQRSASPIPRGVS